MGVEAIYGKRYCPDKAIAVLHVRAIRWYSSMNNCLPTYLPTYFGGYDYLTKKSEMRPRKDQMCGSITHLEEYVDGEQEVEERIVE